MGRRTTIILNDKLFTKLLKIQSEKILESNTSIGLNGRSIWTYLECCHTCKRHDPEEMVKGAQEMKEYY